LPRRILKRDLDVIEARGSQFGGARFVEPDAGGDEIAVKTELVPLRYERSKIVAQQRLATGEAELHGAERACLPEYPFPFVGRKLLLRGRQVQWIGAINAVQRAAVSQLREQPQGRPGPRSHRWISGRTRSSHGGQPRSGTRRRR